MTVIFDTLTTKEYQVGTDSDGYEWIRLRFSTPDKIECWECEKAIEGDYYWLQTQDIKAYCVRCVEGGK